MLFEADDSVDELTPWGKWDDDVDVAVQIAPDPAQARDGQIEKSLAIHEAIRVKLWSSIRGDAGPDDLLVAKLEFGKIKMRRYVKQDDGTRPHGRPPDLTSPAPSAPPFTPSATMTAYLLRSDEGVARPVVVLKGLHRTIIMYFVRSLRRRTCFPIDDEEWNAKTARALRTQLRTPL